MYRIQKRKKRRLATSRETSLVQAASENEQLQLRHDDLLDEVLEREKLNMRSTLQNTEKRGTDLNNETKKDTAIKAIDQGKIRENSHTMKTNRRCISWEDRIQELKEFWEEHGHCNVTQRMKSNTSLGSFVKKIREYRKRMEKGTYTGDVLTVSRMKELDEIGFSWSLKDKPCLTFDERLTDLQSFKDKFGHCTVPREFKDDMSLARWCHVMRTSYRQIKEKSKPAYKLSKSEILQLESMGFKWRLQERVRNKVKIKLFPERIEELKAFKKKHGHLRVTPGLNCSLANFCGVMRSTRRNPDKLNRANLTEEKIKALNDLGGFEWEVRLGKAVAAKNLPQDAGFEREPRTRKESAAAAKNLAGDAGIEYEPREEWVMPVMPCLETAMAAKNLAEDAGIEYEPREESAMPRLETAVAAKNLAEDELEDAGIEYETREKNGVSYICWLWD